MAALLLPVCAAARPTPRHALLQRLNSDADVIGIVHWGLNTYTDREWGFGDEDPTKLNPEAFDADQIVGACAAGGLKGLVIVAKHHDGFCLWPTKTTAHNISQSPFRGGKGDYVREMERACRKAGLKFGVYISPWDRNSAFYGTEKYVDLYHEQIRELLSGDYGEVFEMWFDGANGGDGYYGGAREKRKIAAGYYRFGEVFGFVRALQPSVTIFAGEEDASDFRWPGNERGELDPNARATICSVGGFANGEYGNPDYAYQINVGAPSGAFFRVPEVDFPLRPNWFYHAYDKGRTKSAAYLIQRYLKAVGNGGTMNLGIAPMKNGRLCDDDCRALKGFKTLKDAFFAHESRDGEPFNVVVLSEDIAQGERVDHWRLFGGAKKGDRAFLADGRAIGRRRIRIIEAKELPRYCELCVLRFDGTRQPDVTMRRYRVDDDLLRTVRAATSTSGETDTAKWMQGVASTGGTRSVASASFASSPEELFAHPPHAADVGVWWHWMGSQISREGIVKDLDYFQRMGVGYATIFGLADTTEPWATPVAGGPFPKVVAFTPDWWRFVKFACIEGRKRGIEIGLHNCPGYTSTGGPWIPPRLAMRELVFNVSPTNPVPLAANAVFPIWDAAHKRFGKPDEPARRTDIVDIATVKGIRVSHVPTGAFVQPAQNEARGLECDKMNPEAVAFHLDHLMDELKRHLGDEVGRGLKYVLLDSYEAGTPTWTPGMAAEFKRRRGYDCVPLLPVLGGFHIADEATEKKFLHDFDETRKDLYRDVLFKIMREKLNAAGLAFECEPYEGPFRREDGVAAIDRPMFEFWYEPHPKCRTDAFGFNRLTGPDGTRQNIVEAEAFTGQPKDTAWTETLASLKGIGDIYFQSGVNRFFLHTNPLQPYADDVRPGMTMGRWGTHFGRTQTWAEPAKAWFDYLRRCQALLQWGALSDAQLPLADPIRSLARTDGRRTLHFVVNMSDASVPFTVRGKWFDPVSGAVETSPEQLAPRQSGFLEVTDAAASPRTQKGFTLPNRYEITFGEKTVASPLFDWTRSDDAAIRYFSGTAVYRTAFDAADDAGGGFLDLGDTQGNVCEVTLNGRTLGTVWTAPWRVRIPSNLLKAKDNALVIRYTNTWANRLIGDEQFPDDTTWCAATHGGWYPARWPDWLGKGLASRPERRRKAWCAWRHYVKDSPLVPSGLLGPLSIVPAF